MNVLDQMLSSFDELPQSIQNHLTSQQNAFDIEGISSKGQNGYVILGRNRITGAEVATKYYYWGGRKDWHLEPQRLAAVQHPNITKLTYAGYVDHDWAFFEMPRLRGGDLDDFIAKKPINLKQVISLAHGIANGISALHADGFLHRDLKPENVLLDAAGTAVIADFGSVRSIPTGENGVTGFGHTIVYRPPESFDGLYTRAGDVYQCGIVLYQLLGGRFPYNTEELLSKKELLELKRISDYFEQSKFVDRALETRIKAAKLLNFRSLPSWTPRSVKAIIKRAAALDPERRYQTASELCTALHQEAVREPNWIESEGETRLIMGRKEFRIRAEDSQTFFAERRIGSRWRRYNSVEPGNKESVLSGLRSHLGR